MRFRQVHLIHVTAKNGNYVKITIPVQVHKDGILCPFCLTFKSGKSHFQAIQKVKIDYVH